MSIIHEALRKAELEKTKHPVPEPETVTIERIFEPVPLTPRKKEEKTARHDPKLRPTRKNFLPVVLIAAGVVLFLTFCFLAISLLRDADEKNPVPAGRASAPGSIVMTQARFSSSPDAQSQSKVQIISVPQPEAKAQEPVLVPGIPISQVQVAPASAVKKSPEKRGLFNAKKTEYRLMGIIVTDRSRTAVINNRDVEAGGTIDGAKVKTITSETVVLEKKGKEFTLSLY